MSETRRTATGRSRVHSNKVVKAAAAFKGCDLARCWPTSRRARLTQRCPFPSAESYVRSRRDLGRGRRWSRLPISLGWPRRATSSTSMIRSPPRCRSEPPRHNLGTISTQSRRRGIDGHQSAVLSGPSRATLVPCTPSPRRSPLAPPHSARLAISQSRPYFPCGCRDYPNACQSEQGWRRFLRAAHGSSSIKTTTHTHAATSARCRHDLARRPATCPACRCAAIGGRGGALRAF